MFHAGDDMEGYLGIFFVKRPESAQMRSGYPGRGFYLEGSNQFTMLFNEQIHFAAVVGAPKIKSRFAAQIVEVSAAFQDYELFKKPSKPDWVRRGGKLPGQAVHHSQVKKIKFRVGDQTMA
jgi:hypothetical protein